MLWSALLRLQEVGKLKKLYYFLKLRLVFRNIHNQPLLFLTLALLLNVFFVENPFMLFSFIGFPFTEMDFLVENAVME